MPDDPQDRPQEGQDDDDQQHINTDPARAPQDAKKRRIVAPDPEKVDASERQQQDDPRDTKSD